MDKVKCPFCGKHMDPIEFYDSRFGDVYSLDCDNCGFRPPFKTSSELVAKSVNDGSLKHLMVFGDGGNDYADVDLDKFRSYLRNNGWYPGSLIHADDLFKVCTAPTSGAPFPPYEAYIRIWDNMPQERIRETIKQISEIEGISMPEIFEQVAKEDKGDG